uniref:Ras protein-specific guanine nucleotide-releasing factor 2b n=1 Tax=Callorhinchus milii TaxID=7868 RepID=A0A4W3I978_CALMI
MTNLLLFFLILEGLLLGVWSKETCPRIFPYFLRSDIRLHSDDIDICFSKTLNSCKVPQIRYASVQRLLERLTDLRFLSIDFLNTFLHTYRTFTSGLVVLEKLTDIYKKPFTSIPFRSLELFFATSQSSRSEHMNDGKSPRLCRKFSSPPPLSISRTSSPIRTRKLSLSSPVNSRVGALDLSTTSSSTSSSSSSSSSSTLSNPTSAYTPNTSPPPVATKVPLDLSKGPSPPDQIPLSTEENSEHPLQSGVMGAGCREMDNARCSVSPTSAFAIATAAAGHGSPSAENTGVQEKFRRVSMGGFNNTERMCDKEFIIRRAATNRVLNVLRHWVSKHSQDFEMNSELKACVLGLLEEVMRDPDLLPQERKATANILSALSHEELDDAQLRMEDIIQLTNGPRMESFETLSAMELAEQLTLLDHIVFRSIPYEEFLGQGWMKLDKNERTPYIMKTSKHFNDMSNLVASQIMIHTDVSSRATSIEKWVAVGDICRCMHNYNGVLEITSALNRSAIYRLKKTWAKVCKQTKAVMDKLQKTVSSEGRFKNLRETLKNCNPPCVPYLGMYLTDLAFIEEGTPNFTEEGLVNFSKMRMISHIIREIRQFQQTPYRIDHQPKVIQYLLDKAVIMDEDTLYELSLKLEPRLPA